MRMYVTAMACVLTACAIPQQRIEQMGDGDLCATFGDSHRNPLLRDNAPSLRDEINRRQLLTSEEWSQVNAERITVGSKQCALYAAWGRPARENRSVGSYGTRIQHVYESGARRYSRATYVYTRNGIVTSFQD